MWQGILQGLMLADEERARKEGIEESRRVREEDMAFRREMFNAQILEGRRAEALAVVRERREQDRAVQEAINGAVAMGFDRRAADALQASNQLGFVMRSLEAQEFSPRRISAMSEEILRQLGDRATDETVSNAVVGVVERGTDLNNTRETALSIAESLLDAEGIEQIEALEERAFQLGTGTGGMTPFDISLGTESVDTPELARIRTNILQRVSGFFPELELVSVGDGNVIAQNAPRDLALLITNMENQAFQLATRAGRDRLDPADAVLAVTNPIIELQRVAPGLDVSALNQNFAQIYSVPAETFLQEFAAPVVQPPPPPAGGSSEAADFMGTAIERQPRQAGGVRTPQVTPPAGFAFDPNEEID
jgi:hypothetical protein